MDRIVNSVTASLDRTQQYEGRARRLAAGRTPEPGFRALVTDPARASQEAPPVSGWAGLVTAGRTGPTGSAEQPEQPAAPAPEAIPTLESVFGESPWMAAPAGQGPLGVYYYNPVYFATAQTAQKVAAMLGGKVVEKNAFCGAASPFQQLQANYMVELPGGRVTNPGLVATYYMHGYPQSFIDRLLSIERNETAA